MKTKITSVIKHRGKPEKGINLSKKYGKIQLTCKGFEAQGKKLLKHHGTTRYWSQGLVGRPQVPLFFPI